MSRWLFTVCLATAALAAGPAVAEDDLARAFADPPHRAGIRAFWWWLNGNVTEAAITRDLEEMKAKGFSGAMIFDADGSSQRGNRRVPAGPTFASPAWRALFVHAVREAERLGLELSLNIQSGWNLGGPGVTPEHAAQRLVWSTTKVRGPAASAGPLKTPGHRDGFYRDAAVIAVPVRPRREGGLTVRASSSQESHPAALGVDGDPKTFWVSQGARPGEGPTPRRPQWLAVEMPEPATVTGLFIQGRPGYGPRTGEVQVTGPDGAFRPVCSVAIPDGKAVTQRFEAVTAKQARLLVTAAYDPNSAGVPRNVQVAEMALLDAEGKRMAVGSAAGGRPIRDLALKAAYRELGGSAPDCRHLLFDHEAVEGERVAARADVLDLTDRFVDDGTLRWRVPEGEWIVLRFGHTTTGAHVSTSSGAWTGRVLDYMSPEALRDYWRRNVAPLVAAIGPGAGTTLKYFHTDSWECGGMNWTAGFDRAFRERRGYDPRPWLPVIAGHLIEDREASNAFLADFRKTIADLVADHYGLLSDLSTAHGIGIHPESAGPHAGPMDGLKNYGRSDLMMSEFWSPSPHRPHPPNRFFVKQAASAAHIYGKRLVGAEAFTTIGPHWDDVPWATMKPAFDHEVCDGLNLVFTHTFTCSPDAMGRPGQEYFAGTHFNPNVTWWPSSGAFTRYMARCQVVAQQGRFVADVLYYYGDHVPNIARRKGDDPAKALPGFDYDVINEELLPKLSMRDGRLALPSGMRYRLLALPDHRVLSLKALREVSRLVTAGATVLGPKPLRAVSLEGGAEGRAEFRRLADALWGAGDPPGKGSRAAGAGRVRWGMTAHESLRADGLKPDCAFESAAVNPVLDWIHYTVGDADVYFVCNQRPRDERFTARFRVTGRQPELWDAVDGSIRDATAFAFVDGVTALPLALPPHGSRFVIFRKPAARGRDDGPNATTWRETQPIAGPWEVRFETKRGGPASVRFDTLASWTDRPEEGIRFYSGTAVYRTSFDLKEAVPAGGRLALALGAVQDTGIARVRLNGRDLGVVWCPPFRVDITQAVKPAGNALEVEVTNSWRNRLIGDRDRPAAERLTKTNITIHKSWKLRASGLLGPVRIVGEE